MAAATLTLCMYPVLFGKVRYMQELQLGSYFEGVAGFIADPQITLFCSSFCYKVEMP